MSEDYEQLHARAERDAAELEDEREHLDRDIEKAKAARDRAAHDDWIPTPAPEEPDHSGPESDYPSKD
jgi:hypothetical protein